jgi:DNA-binding transcriptional LysR family regulator
VTLSVSGVTDSIEGDLATGVLDFAVDIAKSQSEDIKATNLAAGSPSIWMRDSHPLASKKTLTLDEILEYPFIQYYLFITKGVNARTDSRFDRELHKLGRKRKKALVTRQFFTAIETLANSDCLMVAAARYGERPHHDVYPIVQKKYPSDLNHADVISLVLLQHKRTIESPIHRWLADAITYIVTKMHLNWG